MADTRLHVLIQDADQAVYQVQESIMPRPQHEDGRPESSELRFSYVEEPFSFAVTRVSNGEVLFDSSAARLVFESQYVRLRTRLPRDANLYGLGEHSDPFRLPVDNYTRTLWNADAMFVPERVNMYGSHPVYFEHRGDRGTHGVFLLNANGMDIGLARTAAGDGSLEYNTIGGVLDLYFLAGPDPEAVSRQYAHVVGLPAMMSYWTLGFHQCKYGWPNVGWVEQVVANYSAANIPLEVVWGDIDYMDRRRDFSVDPVRYPLWRVRDLVERLHSDGQYYVMMLDPGIAYDDTYAPYRRGAEAGAFLRVGDGSWHRGKQWAGQVVWPDYANPKAIDWWTDEIVRFFHPDDGLDFDGLWNDMNEVTSFCGDTTCDPGSKKIKIKHRAMQVESPASDRNVPHDVRQGNRTGLAGRDLFKPRYRIANHLGDGSLSYGTLYTNISHHDGTVQYDTHNLYGNSMMAASRHALLARRPGRRPFVLSRATFAGAGRLGAHWFGDNASRWTHYRLAIRQLLAFAAVHAMPMVGSDVCGFNENATEHLCARWAMLGAFQPFYRNHAGDDTSPQEFYRWPLVAEAARKTIEARYRLLDYMYTALRRASTDGSPVARPLWFVYPADTHTFAVDLQWFLGEAVLVSPVVDQGTTVTFYLPDDIFYDFWTGIPVRGRAENVTLTDVAYTHVPVHIRGGSVVPMRHTSANTTAQLRLRDFQLTVAPGLHGTAAGSLYLDDGDSLDVGRAYSDIAFVWDNGTFTASGTFGYPSHLTVTSIVFLGQGQDVTRTVVGSWSLDGPFEMRVGG